MPTSEEIVDLVNQNEIDSQLLRVRWDSDYSLWRLDPYEGLGAGYSHYTSNEPRTNAKKAIGMLSSAVMLLMVPQGNDDRDTRDDDNAKERFLRGSFRANDARLVRLRDGQPLQQAMAWSLMIRGYTCGRAMMVKEKGRSRVDATPWDPRAVYWEYGHNGLEWICHRFSMLRSAAEKEWGLTKSDNAHEAVVTVYDFYDDERSIVVIPDIREVPVKNDPHGLVDGDGMPRVPGWVMANTLQPPVVLNNINTSNLTAGNINVGSITKRQLADALADFGESIFADTRGQIGTHQLLASIRLNLSERSLKPVFSIKSESGVKTVEYDPWESGSEIPLKIGEEFIIHDALKSAPDTDPLSGIVANEMQKGFFPAVSFGNLPDPISGFAITNLKGGVADKVMGGAQAMGYAYMQISDNWGDHFNTGAFGSMDLSGQGRNRKWFSVTTSPEQLRDLPQAEITIVPELPEDLPGKIQMAIQLAQAGADGMPMMAKYNILETVLNREDSDQDIDTILQEMAITNPLVQAHRITDALGKRGDESWQYWAAQWKMLVIQAMQAGVPLGSIIPPESNPNAENGGAGGFSPQVLPNVAQGIPPPTPGINTPPQQGRVVPQGTPRPGAQTNGNLRGGVPPLP